MLILKKYPHAVAGLILVIFFVVSLVVSSQDSTTMDEKAHIPSGYSYVRYGDMRLNPEHPPLLKDLAGLPLLFLQPNFPTDAKEWQTGINEQWVMGDKFLHQSGNDAQSITYWARFPILIIAVLLGLAIYLWTSRYIGSLAGLFALTLYASDPNVLGHDHLVTTDIGIAAFVFLTTIVFLRWVKAPTMRNTLLFGLVLGLVQLAKFSAVILFPFYIIIAIIYAFVRSDSWTKAADAPVTTSTSGSSRGRLIWEYIWKYTIVVIICFILIEILYVFNTLNMPAEKVKAISDSVFISDNAAAHIARATIDWMTSVPILKPLSEYMLGVFMVFARVAGGNTYYFLGGVSKTATPMYFPAVFLLKETLPLLLLIVSSIGYGVFRLASTLRERTAPVGRLVARYFEEHITEVTMFGFILFYSYLSITSNLNIGFRHLFPMIPFIYILVTAVVWDVCRRLRAHSPDHHPLIRTLSVAFVFWIIAIPILAYPSYISYFNTAAGGHENGYQYVTDSNYDWGQDLIRLRQWVDTYNQCTSSGTDTPGCKELISTKYTPPNSTQTDCTAASTGLIQPAEACISQWAFPTTTPITTMRIDYFGGSSQKYYFGDILKPWYDTKTPEPGWYAVSAGFFQESTHRPIVAGQGNYRWLAQYPMLGRAGDSIFIFYVPEVK